MPLPTAPRSDARSQGVAREWAVGMRVPLSRFNAVPAAAAESLLLGCCRSETWAERIAAHRPYPDLDALLAAVDEATYDLGGDDLTDALAAESAEHLPAAHPAAESAPGTPGSAAAPPGILAAHTALRAAHAAYESKFGHAFLICLDGYQPQEHLDQTLAGVRQRLSNETEEERLIAAEELRRLARARLLRRLG
jgi:2-oxo-4-hydroxy-4-carboxy-5-ureidoimidazoline decarboxylase